MIRRSARRALLACLALAPAACQRGPISSPARARSVPLVTTREQLARVIIDTESRFVLRGRGHAFPVEIPPRARLRIGFGVSLARMLNYPPKPWPSDVEYVDFTVVYSDAQKRQTLAEHRVTKPAQGSGGWHDVTVDVGALAGRRGTPTLEASTPGEQVLDQEIVWTNPRFITPSTATQTNVILISIDTLRADHLGCYGHQAPTSPNADRMADEGVLFRNFIASSSWTLPSHVSMLTGLEPHRHGVVEFSNFRPLPFELETLAERLWDRGYETAGFVAGGFVSNALNFDQGYTRQWENPDPGGPGDTLQAVVDQAKVWIAERQTQPFFVFLHTYAVHLPYAPPPPYDTFFDPEYRGLYERRFTDRDIAYLRTHEADAGLLSHVQALYDGEIRAMDVELGNLLDFLRQTGLAKNTCVFFTSDHGEEFGEHGGFAHDRAKLYDELIRVPLIVWCPSRFRGGQINDGLASHTDIVPTALDLAGSVVPNDLDGDSLLPVLEGKGPPRRRAAISEVDGSVEGRKGTVRAVRTATHKLVLSSIDGSEMLFDLQADPAERHDLRRVAPQLAEQLRAILGGRTGGPIAVAEPITPDDAMRERLRALGYVK